MIGDRLKHIRKEKGLSQKALANILSTSSGYISEVEQGKTVPGGKFLHSLNRVLKLSIDWLLTGEGSPFKEQPEDQTAQVYKKIPDFPIKARDLPPERILKNFKQQELASHVNWNLVKLEEIDPRELWEVNRFIEYRTLKAIESRRKESTGAESEGPPDGQERRSGKDRRKLGF